MEGKECIVKEQTTAGTVGRTLQAELLNHCLVGNRSPELIFCLCLYYFLVPMVRQHDQGNLLFKMFNLGLRFQRVRVHDVRAKAQLRAHILLCKRKAETQRDMQTDKDEIMKDTQTERERTGSGSSL